MWGEEPVNILKKHFNRKNVKDSWPNTFVACPAVKDFYHNIYGIPSLYDYHIKVTDKETTSKVRTQEFFNSNIRVTNQEERIIQFYGKIYFYTDVKSLPITVNYPPFLESTIQHANYISGDFDLGKYPRQAQIAMRFINDTDWNIAKGDILYYVKFHTKEKIKFIPFAPVPEIVHLFDYGAERYKNYFLRKNPIPFLQPYYDAVKRAGIKKLLAKKIKENLTGDYA